MAFFCLLSIYLNFISTCFLNKLIVCEMRFHASYCYNNFINKDLALIKDEPVFKKEIDGLKLDIPNPEFKSLIVGGGKKNHSRRNHKTQVEPNATKEYNIRLV